MDLLLPPGGDGKRTWQRFNCDRLGSLKSDKAQGWLKGELAPKE